MSTGVGNNVTFSETVFSLHMTLGVVLIAVAFALVMGLIGGFFPAWQAARQEILTALRG
jgi:ABC-type antimicrobial peptide transport system permease subunit